MTVDGGRVDKMREAGKEAEVVETEAERCNNIDEQQQQHKTECAKFLDYVDTDDTDIRNPVSQACQWSMKERQGSANVSYYTFVEETGGSFFDFISVEPGNATGKGLMT